MVRVADLSYRVKGTYVEINGGVAADGDPRACVKFSEAIDENEEGPAEESLVEAVAEATACCEVSSPGKPMLMADLQFVPNTPSPFMHPATVDARMMEAVNLMGMGDMLPPAFADDCTLGLGPSFEGQDMNGFCNVPMMYDPATNSYWCMPMEPQLPMSGTPDGEMCGGGEPCFEGQGHGEELHTGAQTPGQSPYQQIGMPLDMHGVPDAPGVWQPDHHGMEHQGDMMLEMEPMQDGQGWGEGMPMMDQACLTDAMMEGQGWGVDMDQGPVSMMMETMQHDGQDWCTEGTAMNAEGATDGQAACQRWSDVVEESQEHARGADGGWAAGDEQHGAWRPSGAGGVKLSKREREREKRLERKELKREQREREQRAWELQEEQRELEQRAWEVEAQQEEQHHGWRVKTEWDSNTKGIEDVETGSEAAGESLSPTVAPAGFASGVGEHGPSEGLSSDGGGRDSPQGGWTRPPAKQTLPDAKCSGEPGELVEAGPSSHSQNGGSDGAKSGGITTVMLRNIPNKYTREMLVNQLNQDFRGRFDFVYLPIDFKNKCNVGYGFLNFRTAEACDEFVTNFNGVDVRKCLPGLNSRKVVEVTPARVQGLEENVRRLRNGPVMNELMFHPEWMPLLLTDGGEERPFPVPDTPCPPTKGRRNRGAGHREDDDEERPAASREGRRSARWAAPGQRSAGTGGDHRRGGHGSSS